MSFTFKIALLFGCAYNELMESFLPKNGILRKIIMVIVLILILIGVYLFASRSQKVVDQAEVAKQESAEVKASLSKHLVLPEGEDPDIRKINQKIDDPFFARAELGDYLIIFYKSRIAYIYSPSKDIISNAGVVFINPQQQTDGLKTNSGTSEVKSN